MVPETALSLLAFVLLISPGLIFEWLRRRHRPSIDRSAFEEIATVVVASLVLTWVAVAVLALVDLVDDDLLASVWLWIREGKSYSDLHPKRSIGTVGLAVAIAWIGGIGANWLLCQRFYAEYAKPYLNRVAAIEDGQEIRPHSALWNVLRGRRDSGTGSVWLSIEVEDGSSVTGAFYACDTEGDPDTRMLVLKKPFIARAPGSESAPLDSTGTWQLLVVPMKQIQRILVLYNTRSIAT